LAMTPAVPAQAVTPDLLISEYIEGSSFNKAIEIYNGTGSDVDLSTYTLELYSNGAATPNATVGLSGILDNGDVYVVANGAADPAILAITDLVSSGVANFNGDDAVVLQGAGGVVDSFGQTGFDPGTEWDGGGQNDTLVRKPTVCQGDTNATDAFDASVEWDLHAQDDFSFLGAHSADCDTGGNAPVVAVCDSPLFTDEGVAASANVSASDTDGTVVGFTSSSTPQPSTGSISIENVVPAGGIGGTATADLVVDASVPVGTYSVTVTATNDDAEPQSDGCVQEVNVEGEVDVTLISAVQGDTETSPYNGLVVAVEGVVVGDYEGFAPALRGFYLQEEDGDQDGDPLTSEGIFVFHGDVDSVSLGDVVRVQGIVSEFQGQTQIGFPDSLEVLASGATVTPAAASLPLAAADDLEKYEGMLVTFPQTLFVTEFFQLGRFGQVVVSSGDRLAQPTSVVEPGAPANALQATNDLNRLIIDDELNNQNPDPIHFGRGGNELTASNTLRGGDTITDAVGVMTYTWSGNSASGNAYRLRVVGDLSDSGLVPGGVVPVFEAANARPAGPPSVGGDVTVASFNVLNYFVTLDQGGTDCGPIGFPQGCRGADTAEELDRQRDKLVSALLEIDTDVIGLIELENTEGVEPLADIVSSLNAVAGVGTWDYIQTGTIGSDVIKVGIIYQPANASPVGDYALLDSSVDPRFDDELNRPTLAQTFTAAGETFTVLVNHLKSKSCTDATGDDADQGDGQACYNAARTSAAEAMVDWVASDPTGSGDPDAIILGDLNSYALEDPIDVLVGAGYVDLGRAYDGADTYSYVFDGQWGYLDYAMASPALVAKVTGAAPYHINADEPSVLDYNTDFKTPNHVNILYAPDEFRTSDHDPIVVGFSGDGGECETVPPVASASADPAFVEASRGYVAVSVTLDVTDDSPFIVELVSVTVNQNVRPNEIIVLDDTNFRLAAKAGRDARVYTITYVATDDCGNSTEFSTTVTVNPRVRNRAV
ncbi:MAG: ExeM/NucH family extracellular endonuclease, partial [Acidimicrobiia bacterium]|nr:ExeM/NucH family extracellular endonuclease [Acidimicrobiia bacterium]